MVSSVANSVSRFDEISPFWQNFKSWAIILGLNVLRPIFNAIGQILIVANGLILANTLAIWSHGCKEMLRSLTLLFVCKSFEKHKRILCTFDEWPIL